VTYVAAGNDKEREWELLKAHARGSTQTKAIRQKGVGRVRADTVLIADRSLENNEGYNRYAVGRLRAIVEMEYKARLIQVILVESMEKRDIARETQATKKYLDRVKIAGMQILKRGALRCYPAQWVERSCHLIPLWTDLAAVKSPEVLKNPNTPYDYYLLSNHTDKWSYWNLF